MAAVTIAIIAFVIMICIVVGIVDVIIIAMATSDIIPIISTSMY